MRQGGTLVLRIGRNFFSPRETTVDRVQLADTMTWVRGAHKVKGGVDLQMDDVERRPDPGGGRIDHELRAGVEDLQPVGAGLETGKFLAPHGIALDSTGDIYLGEVGVTNWKTAFPNTPMPKVVRCLQKLEKVG